MSSSEDTSAGGAARGASDGIALALLLGCVIGANLWLAYRFDGLLHDDAQNVAFIYEHGFRRWFGIPFEFNGLREDIRFHLATYASPFLARVYITVVYLGGSCFLLWRLLRTQFRVEAPLAFAISALPFLTWSIWQIPIGINISYVAGDVLYALLAATLIVEITTRPHEVWIKLPAVALLYFIATEVMPSSIVLTPLLFVFAATLGPASLGWRMAVAGLMALASLQVIGAESAVDRKGLVAADVIFANLGAAISQVPQRFNPNLAAPAWWAALVIALVGLGGLIAEEIRYWLREGWRGLWAQVRTGSPRLCAWASVAALLVYSLAPYIVSSSSWPLGSQERYYYIWQFGFWAVFVLGAAWSVRTAVQITNARLPALGRLGVVPASASAVVLSLFVIWCVGHRATTTPPAVKQATGFTSWFRKEILRVGGGPFEQALLVIQPSTQTGLSHISNPPSGVGFWSFIVGDHVRYGVIAVSDRCSHIFDARVSNWGYYEVSGFSPDRALRAFRVRTGDPTLFEYAYGLDFETKERPTLWSYGETPERVLEVEGPAQLQAWLTEQGLPAADVAWAEPYLNGACKFEDRQFR